MDAKPFRTDHKSLAANSDVLTAESDHRIANHLGLLAGLLRIQASRLPNELTIPTEDARILLKGAAAKIEGIGRLHRLLSTVKGADQVDLAEYIHSLVDVAVSSLALPDQVSVVVEVSSGISVSSGDAAAIGLFVEEAIINSLKYAHPTGVSGEIIVGCQINGPGGYVLEVADDGVGLPEGFDPDATDSFGVRLMRSLAMQIGAEVEFTSSEIGLGIRLIKPSTQLRVA